MDNTYILSQTFDSFMAAWLEFLKTDLDDALFTVIEKDGKFVVTPLTT